MKKIFFSLLAVISMLATSCSNDDIEIQTVGQFRQLNLNVDVTSPYEPYGINDFINLLGDNDEKSIAVVSLLYDKNGDLVDRKTSFARSFNNVSQNFYEVVDGKYTVVSIVTIVDDNEFNAFTIEDTDKISTLWISSNYETQYWYRCVASVSKSIEINGDETIEVVPEIIGSMVDIEYEGLNKSKYNWFALEIKNKADGYSLNPSLSKNKRYIYENYNASNYWTSICRFYEQEGLLDGDRSTKYIIDAGQLNYCFGLSEYSGTGDITFTAFNNSYYNFTEGKIHYAYCYYVGGDKVVETYLGDSNGLTNWYNSLDKSQGGGSTSDLFSPIMNWGSTVKSVQKDMNGYEMIIGSNGVAEYVDEDMYAIAYSGKGLESEIYYFFTTSNSGLYQVYVMYPSSVGIDNINNIISKEYEFLAEESGMYMYVNSTHTTMVGVTILQGNILVSYMDFEALLGAPEKRDTNNIISKLKQVRKNSKGVRARK